MKISSRFFAYLFSILAAAFWGTQTVAIKEMISKGVDTMAIAAGRFYVGVVVLFVIYLCSLLVTYIRSFRLARKGKRVHGKAGVILSPNPEIKQMTLFWISALTLGLSTLFHHYGLQFTLASDAGLIMNFAPMVVLFLSGLFLMNNLSEIAPTKGHFMKIMKIMMVGSVLTAFILAHDQTDSNIPARMRLAGDLLQFLAMITFAVYVVAMSQFMRNNTHVKSSALALLSLLVAVIPISFFVPWHLFLGLVKENWVSFLWIGGLTTGFGFWFWYMAAKRLNVVLLVYNIIYFGLFAIMTEKNLSDMYMPMKLLAGAVIMIGSNLILEFIYTKAKEEV